MSIETEAVEQFELWLPGELEYSARKAGYDKKIKRAEMPAEDRRSIHGFLSQEWHNFRLLRDQGAYHTDTYGMNAQLQISKLAAGFFDKVGIAKWLSSLHIESEASFVGAAREAAVMALQRKPWEQNDEPLGFVDQPFEETPFHEGVHVIMSGIVRAANTHDAERTKACKTVAEKSLEMGGLAVRCYQDFAQTYLDSDELVLPPSQAIS